MFQTFFFLLNFPFNLVNDLFKKGTLLLQAPAAQLRVFGFVFSLGFFWFVPVPIKSSQVWLKDSCQKKCLHQYWSWVFKCWGLPHRPFFSNVSLTLILHNLPLFDCPLSALIWLEAGGPLRLCGLSEDSSRAILLRNDSLHLWKYSNYLKEISFDVALLP